MRGEIGETGGLKPHRAVVDDAFHLRAMGDARRDPRRPGGRKQAQQRAIVEGQAHAALAGEKYLRHIVPVAAGVVAAERRADANHRFVQRIRVECRMRIEPRHNV